LIVKARIRLILVLFVFLLAIVPVAPAFAQGNAPVVKPAADFGPVPISATVAVELISALVFCAYVVMYSIEGLKSRGIVQDGKAGKWNEGLSFLIGLGGYFLVQLGAGAQIDSAKAAAPLLGPGIAFVIANVVLSKTFYEIVKWARGSQPQTAVAANPGPK
jgi:hypothetical protein